MIPYVAVPSLIGLADFMTMREEECYITVDLMRKTTGAHIRFQARSFLTKTEHETYKMQEHWRAAPFVAAGQTRLRLLIEAEAIADETGNIAYITSFH